MEIIGVILLCNVNKKNAAARSERPGKYIGFTILLWVGLEIIGAVIGAAAELGMGSYVLALVFAGIGGFISYRLAKGNGAKAVSAAPLPYYPPANAPVYGGAVGPQAQPASKFCSFCGSPAVAGAGFCQKCGKSLAPAQGQPIQPPVQAAPAAAPPVPRAQLIAAARTVFNNPFSSMTFDPENTLWKEPIQKELALLVRGGVESVSVLGELLMQCAAGQGGGISGSWWYGGVWAVKAAAMLPKKEAADLMVRLLQKESNIYEWFTYVQGEAARQLGVIGDTNALPALQKLLEQPLSMSPVSEIAKTVEVLNGSAPQTPPVILAKAQNQLGDADGIEYLLPFMDQIASWDKKNIGFYYFLLAKKSERLGYALAARAFFAAQIAACPEPNSMGWQAFKNDGVEVSPETAHSLSGQYPVPKTVEEIKSYASKLVLSPASETQAAAAAPVPAPPDPDGMSASELIDFMTTDEGIKIGLGFLGMKLSGKLKAGFYDRPQDIEKALRVFGDENIVARFNMIKSTMNPDDLDLLLPDLLTKYAGRRR